MIDYKVSNNEEFRYIFIIIDNFSKYPWCTLPKNKNSQTITEEFSNILTTSKQFPAKLESDSGKEWYNSIFQIFLRSKIVQHYSRYTARGPSIAERVIRTLRGLLEKPVFEKGKTDWISELSSALTNMKIQSTAQRKRLPFDLLKNQ